MSHHIYIHAKQGRFEARLLWHDEPGSAVCYGMPKQRLSNSDDLSRL